MRQRPLDRVAALVNFDRISHRLERVEREADGKDPVVLIEEFERDQNAQVGGEAECKEQPAPLQRLSARHQQSRGIVNQDYRDQNQCVGRDESRVEQQTGRKQHINPRAAA